LWVFREGGASFFSELPKNIFFFSIRSVTYLFIIIQRYGGGLREAGAGGADVSDICPRQARLGRLRGGQGQDGGGNDHVHRARRTFLTRISACKFQAAKMGQPGGGSI